MSNGIAGLYSATITVVDRRKGYFALDATIPDLGDYDIRFIRWDESLGNAPTVGTSGMADMVPMSRQKRFLPGGQKHKYDSPDVDGSEWASEVEWAMMGFDAGGVSSPGATPGQSTGQPTSSPRGNISPGAGTSRASGQSVNTSTDGALTAQDRWIADHRMKNSRDSIWMAIEKAKQAAGTSADIGYDDINDMFSDLVITSQLIRDELNKSLDEAIGISAPLEDSGVRDQDVPESKLVEAAKDMGAEVVEVVPGATARNAAEVREYVKQRQEQDPDKWSRKTVVNVLVANGYKTLDDYIAAEGHTAQGALELLTDSIDGFDF